MKSMRWWTAKYRRFRVEGRIFLAPLAFLLMINLLVGCGLLPAEQTEENLPNIEPPKISKKPEMTVTRGPIEISIQGQGKVFSKEEELLYFVGSEPPSNGQNDTGQGTSTDTFRLKGVYVKPGDHVTAGQLLAEVETQDLDLEIERSANDLKVEEQKLITELRKEPMTEADRIAQEQMKAAFLEKQIAHQKLVRKLVNSKLTAPYAGRVEAVYYNPGDSVKPYDPVFLLINPNDLMVGVRVTDKDLESLHIDQEARVTISGVNEALTGRIIAMPNPNNQQKQDPYNPYNPYNPYQPVNGRSGGVQDERSQYLLISLDKVPEGVTRGTNATASIVLQRKEDVVKIPLSFLYTYGGRNYVIVTDGETKREVDVELGLQSATEVEILSGLRGGERIVGR
ncbi:efflux RND transporter periplasmic adaptor subunit [Thermicanus aegyptius]|uniref:efflux RND transporter periplasmic adaptor subunit n=1 Tax=Thermicanus aegyptius TaxID=94009 RepID=UPI00048D56EA|nr:HlyD family efflux transporter periplasmic adaptor subunit [Thermicanus aegyptius]